MDDAQYARLKRGRELDQIRMEAWALIGTVKTVFKWGNMSYANSQALNHMTDAILSGEAKGGQGAYDALHVEGSMFHDGRVPWRDLSLEVQGTWGEVYECVSAHALIPIPVMDLETGDIVAEVVLEHQVDDDERTWVSRRKGEQSWTAEAWDTAEDAATELGNMVADTLFPVSSGSGTMTIPIEVVEEDEEGNHIGTPTVIHYIVERVVTTLVTVTPA